VSVRNLIADYDAVMGIEGDLISLMEPNSDCPPGQTLEEGLIDLGWHQRPVGIAAVGAARNGLEVGDASTASGLAISG
jgi:hypothetical protein